MTHFTGAVASRINGDMAKPLQFRLRTIFLLTTIIAIACTCLIPREALKWEITIWTRLLAATCVMSVPLTLAIAVRVLIDSRSKN